jgi:hypothetical protein
MAMDIFPKAWGRAPDGNSKANYGHPLCPQFGFIMNNGWHDLVKKTPVIISGGTGTWRRTSVRGYPVGSAREHTATSDVDRINVDALVIFPTNGVNGITVLHAQEKTDGVARNAVALSAETTNNAAFTTQAYLPFQDGNAYWDWGGQTNGVNRVGPVSGLTFGDDIWVFTTGPRGMEMWQNAILRASNGANPSKSVWGAGTETMCWGKSGFGGLSDLRVVKMTYIWHRQLTQSEIAHITKFPFCWVDPRS